MTDHKSSSGRCNDPNCSCRSPDLQWYTNQVLRRDGTRTDYIVLPLVAGVMARCVLAEDRSSLSPADLAEDEEVMGQARAVLELAAR
ncbi:MAG TPA: hypothetical protein VMH39_09695, partial [Gemmatimonadaceae bacterium]|nr:hypothetical protein [Gemmatimonadaceae bacterium]